jgi:hypothetical protein
MDALKEENLKEMKMKCRVCLKEANGTCLCGFCIPCIELHGHINCETVIREREKDDETRKN